MNIRVIRILPILILSLAFLAACNSFQASTPAPLPTVMLEGGAAPTQAPLTTGGGVVASGEVIPAQIAEMAFSTGGNVAEVNVAVGDRVDQGQVLVRLAGGERLAAAVSTSETELFLAQQAYDELNNNLESDRNLALQALNRARQGVRDTEKRLSALGGVVAQTDIDLARTQLIFAENNLKDAREKFKRFENLPENNLARARVQVEVIEAQKKYDQALRKYNSLTGTPSDFDRKQAQTDLQIAQNQLDLAQKDYDRLQAGPDPQRVKAAEARIQNARAQLAASQAALADLELKAPFAGEVVRVNIFPGEWVLPGESILVLANLDDMLVETTDLSERDIPRVSVGQPVKVFIKALNQEVTGKVSEISALADRLGGDVVYHTRITIDNMPPGLLAGMSADVTFEANP